jgi:hypothetical protein
MKEMRRYKLHATNAACSTAMKLPPRPSCFRSIALGEVRIPQ